jgi:hypothetical protein
MRADSTTAFGALMLPYTSGLESLNFGDFLNKSSGMNIIKCRKYIFLFAFEGCPRQG